MTRIFLCCFVLGWVSTASAADPPVFRWQRAVELPTLKETGVVSVELDEHFHAKTRLDWPDYRLRNDQDLNIGSVLVVAQETETRLTRQTWVVNKFRAQVSDEHGLQVDFTLEDKSPPPESFGIDTPLRDFEHQVRVESSADGVTWTAAGEPTLIFDYSKYIDARNVEIPVNGGDHRHFRLTIADITAEQETQLLELNRRLRGGQEAERTERTTIQRRPLRIDRLYHHNSVRTEREKQPRMRTYPATDLVVTQNEKEHQTIVSFNVDRQPITRVRVLIADQNFSRAAHAETEAVSLSNAGSVEHQWIEHRSATLTRIDVAKLHRENLVLEIAARRENVTAAEGQQGNRFRVVIENGDSPPLNITGVEPLGPVYELKFLAEPGQKLRLDYGSPDASAGRMDIAALQAALQSDLPVLSGKLGEPRENTAAPIAAKPTWKPWNDPLVLFGGIVVLTLLLGWGLYRASSRITLPPEGP